MRTTVSKWLAAGTALLGLAFCSEMLYGRWRIVLPAQGMFTLKELKQEFQREPLPQEVYDKFDLASKEHLRGKWKAAQKKYLELGIQQNGQLVALADLSAAVSYNIYLTFRVENQIETAEAYRRNYQHLQDKAAPTHK